MQMDKNQIKCIYYDAKKDKCNCKERKKWYGKPKCVLREHWNSLCPYKFIV